MKLLKLIILTILLSILPGILGCGGGSGGSTPSSGPSPTPKYTLTIHVNPAGSGTVITNPNSTVFEANTIVYLIPSSSENYVFSGWSEPHTIEEKDGIFQIKMDGDKQITANFTKTEYQVNIIYDSNKGKVVKELKSEATPQMFEITAYPEEDWKFVQWNENSALMTNENPTTITIDGYKTIEAIFDSAKLSIDYEGKGTVKKDLIPGTIRKVRLTAQPDEGWYFEGWTGDLTGDVNPAEVKMDSDKTITAVFKQSLGTVTGTITDGRAGPALAGAAVTAYKNGDVLCQTLTNSLGQYSFEVPSGTGIDIIASKDGYGSAKYQGITVVKDANHTLNLIMLKAFNDAWSTIPPVLTVSGVSSGQTVSGTINISASFSQGNDPNRACIYLGEEYSEGDYVGYPFQKDLNTKLLPNGPSYVSVLAYDINRNSTMVRIPVNIMNTGSSGEQLTMTNPIIVEAITEGSDMQHYQVTDAPFNSNVKKILSLKAKSFSTMAAEKNSSCYVYLEWENEFRENSNFKGFAVYRSNSNTGPWLSLGSGYLDEIYTDYNGITHEWYYCLDLTSNVTPGQPAYYKVVPIQADGSEGIGKISDAIIPLGRYELNLVSPANNATNVSLTPTFQWSSNSLVAKNYRYNIIVESLIDDSKLFYFIDSDKIVNSVTYDPNDYWYGLLTFKNNQKYQWDIYAVAEYKYSEYSKAYSYAMKGQNDGAANGAFVFTTVGP